MSAQNTLGEYLTKNIIERQNITQQDLARKIGVSRQTINGLINGNIQLSDVMALRLSRHLGETPDFWLSFQDNKKSKSISREINKLEKRWRAVGQHTLVDHEIIEADSAGMLGIKSFSRESVQPASYDLRIGNAIVSDKGGRNIVDIREEPLEMPPGATAIVQTLEEFDFPLYLLGRLGCMSKLASKGIITIHGHHVDPGFKGFLHITLKNVGNNQFFLMYGKTFLSLEIIYLPVTPSSSYKGDNLGREDFSTDEKETIEREEQNFDIKQAEEALEILSSLIKKQN